MKKQPDPTKPLPVQWAAAPVRELPAVICVHLVDLTKEAPHRDAPSDEGGLWPGLSLVIHVESMPDEFASLRFGTYIVEWLNPLVGTIERLEAGFFTGESLSKGEAESIVEYRRVHNLIFMTRRQWLEQVLFKYGYYAYGAVVGFDLPHVLSRLATRVRAIEPPRPQKVRRDGSVFFYCGGCHQRRTKVPTAAGGRWQY